MVQYITVLDALLVHRITTVFPGGDVESLGVVNTSFRIAAWLLPHCGLPFGQQKLRRLTRVLLAGLALVGCPSENGIPVLEKGVLAEWFGEGISWILDAWDVEQPHHLVDLTCLIDGHLMDLDVRKSFALTFDDVDDG